MLSSNKNVWIPLWIIVAIITLSFFALFYFIDIFIILTFGIILVIVVESIIGRFEEETKKYTKRFGYILAVLVVILITSIFYIALSYSLFEVVTLVKGFDTRGNVTIKFFENLQIGDYPYLDIGISIAKSFISNVEKYILSGFSTLLSKFSQYLITGTIIIPPLIYTYAKYRNSYKKYVYELAPIKYRKAFVKGFDDISLQLYDYSYAKIVESFVISVICVIGFYLIGLKGWLFFGLLSGFLNIIPYLGVFIGTLPPLIVGLIQDPMISFWVLVVVIVAQAVDNFYLVPFMISKKVRLNPLLTVILILAGAKLFGPWGMILAVPIYLVYSIVIKEAYQELVNIYGYD